VATDEWSPQVATKADRWEAVRLVNTALARVGHPARLSCLTGPWVVRTPTGGARLADSLTEVWRHCRDVHPLADDALAALAPASTASVAGAVHAAAAAVLGHSTDPDG
jgi:hypothetical protein